MSASVIQRATVTYTVIEKRLQLHTGTHTHTHARERARARSSTSMGTMAMDFACNHVYGHVSVRFEGGGN